MEIRTLTVFLLCVFSVSVASLQCYIGRQDWSENINNISLVQCPPDAKCCRIVASLNGNQYSCSDDCPRTSERKCGPDPRLGIMDVYYCSCKDHIDEDCRPYLGE